MEGFPIALKWLIAGPAIGLYAYAAGLNWIYLIQNWRRPQERQISYIFIVSIVAAAMYATARPIAIPWWAYLLALALDPANGILTYVVFRSLVSRDGGSTSSRSE